MSRPDHRRFMRRALSVARRGRSGAFPNPLVGAVLVRNGRILAEGAHERFGGPHAEVNVLRRFKRIPADAVLYLTLEPCSHFGKTPPCAEFLVRRGLRRAVIAATDPNPLVAGRGLEFLRKKGVRLTLGVLQKEATAMNRRYLRRLFLKKPRVTVKTGQSLDGKIATRTGQSRWITSEASRKRAHRLRRDSDAVLIGVNTLLRDDPRLTARGPGVKIQPLKAVLDSRLRTPLKARIFSGTPRPRVVIFTSPAASAAKCRALERKARVLAVPAAKHGGLDWRAVLRALSGMGVSRVLIEGGGQVLGSAFEAGIVDEAYFFMAPSVIGGKSAVGSVGGRGAALPGQAVRFKRWKVERLGADLLFHGVC